MTHVFKRKKSHRSQFPRCHFMPSMKVDEISVPSESLDEPMTSESLHLMGGCRELRTKRDGDQA